MIPRDSEYIKCCTGPIKYRDFEAVHSDVERLNKATQSSKPTDGSFMTAASPGVVALFQVPMPCISLFLYYTFAKIS